MTIWDVKYRGKRLGMLYVALDGFLRYAKDNAQIPLASEGDLGGKSVYSYKVPFCPYMLDSLV